MNRKIIIALIFSLFTAGSVFANDTFIDEIDAFAGDAFFKSAAQSVDSQKNNENATKESSDGSTSKSIPPIKRVRLLIKQKMKQRAKNNAQLAPTDPNAGIYRHETNTSEYASKELEENFDENMMPDGFEADEEAINENKKTGHFWNRKNNQEKVPQAKETEDIILDCENMNYDTNNYCLYANGNANVEFVKQQTVVKADKITYDRMNNTIKAEGNVRILKNGQTITGDYIFVDMNEENALIENPITETPTITIKAEKGYVYGDKIVQEKGSVQVDSSFPIEMHPSYRGVDSRNIIYPKDQTITNDMGDGLVKVQAKELQITQKGDLEVLRIKGADIYKGKYKILKIPRLKIYTNKNHEYVESNIWEVGSRRDLGMYIGPGFVFELPKGSVLKAMPVMTINGKVGIGAVGRFQSGTNFTQAGYGTSKSRILIRGEQKLDDNLLLQYSMNDYINEWFMGSRRPKYGLGLIYEKKYSDNDFLLKNQVSSFTHRMNIGYYHDIDRDKYYQDLHTSDIGTLRTKYMAEVSQSFLNYRNEDKLTSLRLDLVGQMSAALYGTGDTQFIGRLGPRLTFQLKRWVQELGYYQSVYDDRTPLPAFDAYRYGKSNVYLREYFRINKYLTVAWMGSLNLSGDSPSNYRFQENAFFISVGPSDLKFNLGYDFVRANTFVNLEVMMDAKGTHVDYDKLVIKQDKKAGKETLKDEPDEDTAFQNSRKAPVLQRAEVEDIRTVEDVL